ncbi:MAG: hypothetical protein ACOC2O_02365, partial [Bacillota bacterium]
MDKYDKEKVLARIKTPNKVNRLLVEPAFEKNKFDSHAVDCPFVFYQDDRYYLTYVGWDSIGYQTGMAVSDDLLNWEKKGLILKRGGKGSITEYNIALTSILRENDLFSPGRLKKINGQYVGTYHSYPGKGYETGPGKIGLCYSKNLYDWQVEKPVLYPGKSDEWDGGGLYKSWIMEDNDQFY